MNVWSQLRAALALPGMVTILIPAGILYATGIGWRAFPWNVVLAFAGFDFVLLGLALMVWTIRQFITVGRGTLAPWDPPKKLIVHGVYRHFRNPMITGVLCVLLGEAAIFNSLALLGWFALFLTVNLIYIPLAEEPSLASRFGDDYAVYKKNVPRWIPRLTAWNGVSESNDPNARV